MIYQMLSRRLVSRLEVNASGLKAYEEIYIYGAEILISSMGNSLIILVLAILLNMEWQTGLYLLGFVPLRMLNGGGHANSHWKCIGLFATLMVGMIEVGQVLITTLWWKLGIVLILLVSLMIGCRRTNPKTAITKSSVRVQSCRYVSVLLILFLCFGLYFNQEWTLFVGLGMMIQYIAQLKIFKGEKK